VFKHLDATRYAVPLREGGSLPAVIDTSDGGQYVVKFRGAGQGARALVAELLAAGLAQLLGLPVPEPAIVRMDEGFGMSEPDPEIQDILRGSIGQNFGLAYLPGAIGFDAAADLKRVDPDVAAKILWFDAFTLNPDRTPRNANLLLWQERLWMIDHGACFYFHHRWDNWRDKAQAGTAKVREHILLPKAGEVLKADRELSRRITESAVHDLVAAIPEEWLAGTPTFPGGLEQREAYVAYLSERLNEPRTWLVEAQDAVLNR
jgi:hypothetical protein